MQNTHTHTLIFISSLQEYITQVSFIGEEAEDGGGPRREFWRLFGQELLTLMEGNPGNCTLRHDAVALTVNKINAACIKLMSFW